MVTILVFMPMETHTACRWALAWPELAHRELVLVAWLPVDAAGLGVVVTEADAVVVAWVAVAAEEAEAVEDVVVGEVEGEEDAAVVVDRNFRRCVMINEWEAGGDVIPNVSFPLLLLHGLTSFSLLNETKYIPQSVGQSVGVYPSSSRFGHGRVVSQWSRFCIIVFVIPFLASRRWLHGVSSLYTLP